MIFHNSLYEQLSRTLQCLFSTSLTLLKSNLSEQLYLNQFKALFWLSPSVSCLVWLVCEAHWPRHCTMGTRARAHLLVSVTRSRFYSLHYPTYYTPFIQLDGYLNPAGEYNDTFLVTATNLVMNWALSMRKQIVNDVELLN